jgi:hypothetical protein
MEARFSHPLRAACSMSSDAVVSDGTSIHGCVPGPTPRPR